MYVLSFLLPLLTSSDHFIPFTPSRAISFRSYQSPQRLTPFISIFPPTPSVTSSDRLTPFTPTGNGSDVFGSDICTCKPYLTFAIEECIRTAQRGGVGVVVYFRKEGRALGEVTKCVFTFFLNRQFRIRIPLCGYFAPRFRPFLAFYLFKILYTTISSHPIPSPSPSALTLPSTPGTSSTTSANATATPQINISARRSSSRA